MLVPTFNGGAALHQAILQLGLARGDVVIMPAFCCGAEIGPFIHAGCELRFYDVDRQLNADLDRIEYLLHHEQNIKAVMVTHYFGFAQSGIERLQQLCDESQTALLEDCAHALYGQHGEKPLGSFGACAVFSPRKILALTEGGLLVANSHTVDKISTKNEIQFRLKKPDFMPWLHRSCYYIQQYFRTVDTAHIGRLKSLLGIAIFAVPMIGIKFGKKTGLMRNAVWLTGDLEGEQAVAVYNTAMSKSMLRILDHTDARLVVEKRRANFHTWLSALSDTQCSTQAQPLFSELPKGCSPLYFPLIVENPAALVSALETVNIESSNWWRHMHPAVDWQHYPVSREFKQQIVALPVHQEMSTAQVNHAAACVKQFIMNSD